MHKFAILAVVGNGNGTGVTLLIILKFLIQILVVSGLIYIVSGRLIGSNINFVRRVLSVVISVTLTLLFTGILICAIQIFYQKR